MKMGTVIAMAAVIWFLGMVTGVMSGRMLIALLIYLFLGAIFPAFGIGVGIVVVLFLLLTRGKKVVTWLGNVMGGKKNG